MQNLRQMLNELRKQAGQKAGASMPKGSGDPRMAQAASGLSGILFGGGLVAYGIYSSMFRVDVGKSAVIFNRLSGEYTVKPEGLNFRVPFFQPYVLFDTRTVFDTYQSQTGTRDLQMVDIALRVLHRPVVARLPVILNTMGPNYDKLVLPSITNETLKSVVAQFTAGQLISQREQVSNLILRNLVERAMDFHIVIEDVSITHMTFGKEYMTAVEAKQVAQQQAEQAKFVVKQAAQDKLSKIIKAEGEAKSAELIGKAVRDNPGYIELQQLEAAKAISEFMEQGNNTVYLPAENLMQDVLQRKRPAK